MARIVETSGDQRPLPRPVLAGHGAAEDQHADGSSAPAVLTVGPEAERRRSMRWMSWLFALALLAAVALFASQRDQQMRFAELLTRARLEWLVVGLLLQLGTYLAEARIWQAALLKARVPRSLRSLMGLGLAKLFLDHTVPTAGVTGTVLAVHALDRRLVPREASMAAVVMGLVSHYLAHALAVVAALCVIWTRGAISGYVLAPALVFAALAAGMPTLLLAASGGARRLPRAFGRVPLVRSALFAIAQARPDVARDAGLMVRCTILQLVILALDALTLWAMLLALGSVVDPAAVFASFMLSTLARILGIVPGGVGVFEAVSIASLRLMGVPLAAGLAATLLFRGLSFWLPMLPGSVFAHRETRAA
jgi:uncharacterized membrane protein YbhN (UPF0104 family)